MERPGPAAPRTVQAPPWLARLLIPFIARQVAGEMAKKYPDLAPEEVAEKIRADLPGDAGDESERLARAVAARLRGAAAVQAEARSDSIPHSTWVLVAANLLPLYAVFVWHWDVFPLLALFWFENVVVGVLNAARMLLADPADPALWAGKLFLVPFFCVHYGMFTLIHGVFVLGLFGGKAYDAPGLNVLAPALRAAHDYNLWLPAAALAASHLFSFLWNYLVRGEYLVASLPGLMTRPYRRVVILHLTIILGGFAIAALHSPAWALVVLIAVKIFIDVKAHRKEHAGQADRAA